MLQGIAIMKIEYKNWTIEIRNDSSYVIGSADNVTLYKKVIFNKDVIPTSQHGVKVITQGKEISSVIICEGGGASTIHDRSFIIKNNELLLCCGDHLYCLELASLNINWKRQLDPATCFGIYEFENDFVVHGELEISRIDRKGNKIWDFSARDIFVTPDGKKSIEIDKDRIKLRDWDGYEYVIDGNGKEIR